MKASEFVTEAPRVPAHAPEILSATDDGKTITIKVRTHDGSVRVLANSNPAVLQQQLNFKYGLRLPHSIARKFVGMPAAMAEDQPDNPNSWESQAADAERDEETAKMAAQDAKAGGLAEGSDHSLEKVWDRYSKHLMAAQGHHPDVRQINKSGDIVQNIRKYVKDHHGQKAVDDMERYAEKHKWDAGVAEGSLNEKSTSQAQFRTMAAAAHNPKFAKKVGISRDVAREFHGADKKSNYKSLPKKAAEDASWGMAPESKGYRK
jgi:hypothetical protein